MVAETTVRRVSIGHWGVLAGLVLVAAGCGGPDFAAGLDATSLAPVEAGGKGADNYLPPIYVTFSGGDGGGPADADVAEAGDVAVEGAPASTGVGVAVGTDSGLGGDTAPPPSATCLPGGSCSPGDCQNGAWACADGGRVCLATTAFAAGTPCGVGGDGGAHVCSAGQCVACSAGGDCSDPATPCVKKTYDCSSGSAQCKGTGNVADGIPCGAGVYCSGGACAACQAGAACSPAANPCHVGKVTACTGGVPTCTDEGGAAAAGESCTAAGAASGVCDGNGACVACAAGAQCNPGGNTCQVGVESCSSGPKCQSAASVREGQTCATNQICHNGTCSACDGASCTSGCCDSHGCVTTAQTVSECGTGTGGGACVSCVAPTGGVGTAVCSGNACAIACAVATPNACGGACVNEKTDDSNCGACGHVCASGYHCNASGTCTCTPAANPCGAAKCGSAPDGCGKMVACGSCAAPLTCDGSGQCVNRNCPTSCPMGDTCGSVVTVGCTTVSCGTCGGGMSCSAAGATPGVCSCPVGTGQCGSACVDTATDGANCGSCGHNCSGGACLNGHCQPTLVASGFQSGPIALAPDSIYVVDYGSGGRLLRITKNAGTITTIATGPLWDVFPFGSSLYYTTSTANGTDGRVTRAALDGSSPQDIATGQSTAASLFVDASGVYWTASVGTGAVMRLGGSDPAPVQFASALPGPDSIAGDANNIYLLTSGLIGDGSDGAVLAIPKGGGGTITIALNQHDATGTGMAITAFGGTVYWDPRGLGNADGAVRSASPNPGAAITEYATNQVRPATIVTDGTYLYWVDQGNGNDGLLQRASLATRTVTQLAGGLAKSIGLVLDGGMLYFTTQGNATVPGGLYRLIL